MKDNSIVLEPTDALTAIDLAHLTLLVGVILSKKPERVLEIGVGTGYTSRAIVNALEFNNYGRLTCVDNWHDYGGVRPPLADELERLGVDVITSSEEEFLNKSVLDSYDIVVSDADHLNTQRWVPLTKQVCLPGGFIFFHDTNSPDYPELGKIQQILKDSGTFTYHFHTNSRADERCNRGWLMAIKE